MFRVMNGADLFIVRRQTTLLWNKSFHSDIYINSDLRVVVDVSALIVLVAGGDITAFGTSVRRYCDFKWLLFLHDPAENKR